MKWMLYLFLALFVLVGAISFAGFLLPEQTTNTRSITLKEKPPEVFAVLADVRHLAEWNRNTAKVETLPPIGGREATRQTFKGGMQMTIVTTESEPPRHLVRSLGDESGPFVGSWTYELSPNDNGTRVVLTEVSRFKNPLYRVMARIFGRTKYIDEHLEDLAKKFGENATVS